MLRHTGRDAPSALLPRFATSSSWLWKLLWKFTVKKIKHQERSLKQQAGRCSGHTCWPLNFDLFMSKVRLSTDPCFSHWSLHPSSCLRIFTISEFLLHNKLWRSQSEKQDYKTIHCLSFYCKTPVFLGHSIHRPLPTTRHISWRSQAMLLRSQEALWGLTPGRLHVRDVDLFLCCP